MKFIEENLKKLVYNKDKNEWHKEVHRKEGCKTSDMRCKGELWQ